MRRVLAMVAKVLAAIPIMIAVWSVDLGKFILKAAGWYRPAAPEQLVESYEDMAHATDVTPKQDEIIARLQLAADQIFRGNEVTPEIVEGLSPRALEWLSLLDADMLLTVGRAKPTDLVEHLASRKTIRGLLRFEADAMAAYKEAVEADLKVPKRPSNSRTRKQEPLLPAFGPIC